MPKSGGTAVFELRMYDSNGDGWNGAYYHIFNAGGHEIASCTLLDGAKGKEYLFLPPGTYSFYIDQDVGRPEEVSWEIMTCEHEHECFDESLFEGGASETAAIGVFGARGGQAVFELQMRDSYGDGWNGAYYQVVDTTGNEVASGTLRGGAKGKEHFFIPPGVYFFSLDTEGSWPEEVSWDIMACKHEGDCSGRSFFAGDINGTVALAVLAPIDECDVPVSEAWAAYRCDELFLGTSQCNGADLTMVADTCGSGGCQVAVGAYMMGKTCGQYCGSHGLWCAASWAIDDASCLSEGTMFELQMLDSYGDGWNGAYYSVVDSAGNDIASGTLPHGTNGTDYLVLPPGSYSFFVKAEDGWPEEISWEIMPCDETGECSDEPLFEGGVHDSVTLEGGLGSEDDLIGCDAPIEQAHAMCRCSGYVSDGDPMHTLAQLRQQRKETAKKCLDIMDDFEMCMDGFERFGSFSPEERGELMDIIGARQCLRMDAATIERLEEQTGLEVMMC